MHCPQLFTDMNHLWNIPDFDVPDARESEVEVEASLHPLHLKILQRTNKILVILVSFIEAKK